MPVVAKIAFQQGITSPGAGFGMIGVSGMPVNATNQNNSSVDTFIWEMLDTPPSSTVPRGIISEGNVPTLTFTPDLPGGYHVHLTTIDISGNKAEDRRVFQVPEAVPAADAGGPYIIPPFDAEAPALNFQTLAAPLGETRGWAPIMEHWLRKLATGGGGGGGGAPALLPLGVANMMLGQQSLDYQSGFVESRPGFIPTLAFSNNFQQIIYDPTNSGDPDFAGPSMWMLGPGQMLRFDTNNFLVTPISTGDTGYYPHSGMAGNSQWIVYGNNHVYTYDPNYGVYRWKTNIGATSYFDAHLTTLKDLNTGGIFQLSSSTLARISYDEARNKVLILSGDNSIANPPFNLGAGRYIEIDPTGTMSTFVAQTISNFSVVIPVANGCTLVAATYGNRANLTGHVYLAYDDPTANVTRIVQLDTGSQMIINSYVGPVGRHMSGGAGTGRLEFEENVAVYDGLSHLYWVDNSGTIYRLTNALAFESSFTPAYTTGYTGNGLWAVDMVSAALNLAIMDHAAPGVYRLRKVDTSTTPMTLTGNFVDIGVPAITPNNGNPNITAIANNVANNEFWVTDNNNGLVYQIRLNTPTHKFENPVGASVVWAAPAAPSAAAVIFDGPAGNPKNIRGARLVDESPINNTKFGIVSIGSDTTGLTTGTTGSYATQVGGDQNVCTPNYCSNIGGFQNQLTTAALYGVVGGGNGNICNPTTSVICGGETNVCANDVGAQHQFIGGGQSNQTSADFSTICGGTANHCASQGFIGGGVSNFCNSNNNVVCGGHLNVAGGPYCAIVGGQSNSTSTNSYDFIGGGHNNAIGDTNAGGCVIAGGIGNVCDNSSNNSVIGGGQNNTMTNADQAVIGGGTGNSCNGEFDVIGGGHLNSTNGIGTVAGGINNAAAGGSIGGGSHNTVSSTGTIPGGEFNSILSFGGGDECSILGGQTNTITSTGHKGAAIVGGVQANVSRSGQVAHADGVYAVQGDNQRTYSYAVTGAIIPITHPSPQILKDSFGSDMTLENGHTYTIDAQILITQLTTTSKTSTSKHKLLVKRTGAGVASIVSDVTSEAAVGDAIGAVTFAIVANALQATYTFVTGESLRAQVYYSWSEIGGAF